MGDGNGRVVIEWGEERGLQWKDGVGVCGGGLG